MRVYDLRIGRFFSVDPLAKGFPWLTPYQYTSNNPIVNIDMDGKEGIKYKVMLGGLSIGTVIQVNIFIAISNNSNDAHGLYAGQKYENTDQIIAKNANILQD